MKILERIAQDIVEKTSEILQYPISITDKAGYIIGASDKSRIGIFHQPSLEVVKKNSMVDCKYEIENKILPGVSVPIKFNNSVVGVLGIVGDPREVDSYGQLVKNQVEMMLQEAFGKELSELKDKITEVFVHQVIHIKENEGNEHILQYSTLLDVNLHIDRVCLLIDITNLSERISAEKGNDGLFEDFPLQYFQRDVLDFLNLILNDNKEDIVSVLNFERFIIIKSLPYQQSYVNFISDLDEKVAKLNSFLERKYQLTALISVGDVSHGIMGVSTSYTNAKKAMNIGIHSKKDATIHLYNEREMMLRLLPKELSPDYQEKIQNIISPLLEHDNYEILSSTFTDYCKYNMNLSETSRNMFIHRNTLIYRLERIKEITSLNPGDFKHCMLLYTAIQCYEESKLK
ncbi:sugar diacid recognition domain-containing protein [Sporosarcina sp. JAI121]|uniref:CdaR family transcriptional regulator n=1 Tax=Sporosarcina sp. JAI121 TaxID=2723064 RepID=UPI0015CAF2F6|nr:sugar diacid recognition domain-containing protein [Sporosarcina sp. JAI121]NYF25246.1 carbohydrate diacid regulator [Sporosarcina sp. JAI121]